MIIIQSNTRLVSSQTQRKHCTFVSLPIGEISVTIYNHQSFQGRTITTKKVIFLYKCLWNLRDKVKKVEKLVPNSKPETCGVVWCGDSATVKMTGFCVGARISTGNDWNRFT